MAMTENQKKRLIEDGLGVVNEIGTQLVAGKNPLTSKTIWVNAGTIAVSVAAYFGLNVAPEYVAFGGTVGLALVNIVLRLVTKEPLDWSVGKS